MYINYVVYKINNIYNAVATVHDFCWFQIPITETEFLITSFSCLSKAKSLSLMVSLSLSDIGAVDKRAQPICTVP